MLDINLFRTGRTGGKKEDGDPDVVRESQRSRFASVEVVDEVIDLDDLWRRSKISSLLRRIESTSRSSAYIYLTPRIPVAAGQYDLDKIRKELNDTSRNTGKLKMVRSSLGSPEDICKLINRLKIFQYCTRRTATPDRPVASRCGYDGIVGVTMGRTWISW